jgi:hypothetical protein
MRKWTSGALVVAALALVMAGCGDGDDEGAVEGARETATSVQRSAEAATRLLATLTGSAEVPGPGDPDGTGTATVNLDATGGRVCYDVSVQKIDRPTQGHIHEGETGASGSPVVTFPSLPTSGDGMASACVENVDRSLMSRIASNPERFYVNVHSGPSPNGAVRGQLRQ